MGSHRQGFYSSFIPSSSYDPRRRDFPKLKHRMMLYLNVLPRASTQARHSVLSENSFKRPCRAADRFKSLSCESSLREVLTANGADGDWLLDRFCVFASHSPTLATFCAFIIILDNRIGDIAYVYVLLGGYGYGVLVNPSLGPTVGADI